MDDKNQRTLNGVPYSVATHTHPVATESVAGLMSAADKLKLDTLTNTPQQNATAIAIVLGGM